MVASRHEDVIDRIERDLFPIPMLACQEGWGLFFCEAVMLQKETAELKINLDGTSGKEKKTASVTDYLLWMAMYGRVNLLAKMRLGRKIY